VVETSEIRLESLLLLTSKNLRDASGPAARFSLGPPTGSHTATSDVEIAGYRVKADMAFLFGRLAVQRVGRFPVRWPVGWTDDGTQRPAIALSATSTQGGGARSLPSPAPRCRRGTASASRAKKAMTPWHRPQ